MQHRLYGLRGNAFKQKYVTLFEELRESILIDFNNFLKQDKKFSPKHLGELCMKYQIPVTVMDQWLPEITNGLYRTGTWQMLRERGVKARDIGVSWD